MPYCCVPFCKSDSKRENVSFHEFPSDTSLSALWLKAISREEFPKSYSSLSKICGKHFVESDFIPNRKHRCLKIGVVPSQFDVYPSFKKKVSIKKQLPAKRRLDVDAGKSLGKICKLTDSSSMTLPEEQLKNDVENYRRHELQSGRLYLKKGVLPHKFECQKKSVPAASMKLRELIPKALQTNVPSAIDVRKDVEKVDPAIEMLPVLYKYCIVPMCKSSTVTTPNKLFLCVPKDENLRKKWCVTMRRDASKNKKLSSTSNRHVCEDHFDLKNDVENYMRHKLQGGRLYLKKGVLPHKFECQKKSVPAASSKRAAARKHREIIAQALKTNVPLVVDVGKDVEEVNPAIGKTHLKKGLKKSALPSLSSTDNLEIIQRKEVASVGQKSMEINCPVSMSVTVSDHQTVIKQEVIEPPQQKVDENLAQEKYCALTQKKITFKDVGNLEARGNQMPKKRITSNSPDTTCKENVPLPIVDIKQEPQDNILTTDQKMERALAITDKLALFMSESSFFHEHMTFLQSIYDSWASGKVALKIQEEDNAKEIQNTINSNAIQDEGSTVEVLPESPCPVSGVTQTGNLVESSIIIPAREKICECPKDSTKAIGFSHNKRHNTASLNNTPVPDSIQIHSGGPPSSRVMTSSVLPTNQVILYQQNSLSRDENPVKDPVPSPTGTILGFIIEAQMNKPQDCIKPLNQSSSFTSLPTILKLNPS